MARTVQLTFDAEDPGRLIGFWCEVLGYQREPLPREARAELEAVRTSGPGGGRVFAAAVDPDGAGPRLLALTVPEGKTAKNRLHLDVHLGEADLLPAEVERLVALGATHVADHRERGSTWATLRDPEGNEFCVG